MNIFKASIVPVNQSDSRSDEDSDSDLSDLREKSQILNIRIIIYRFIIV